MAGKKKSRILIYGLVVLVGLGIAGEVVSRAVLGLGDPPLYMADSKMEYLFKPGHYNRFHNEVDINSYSMRSPEFPEKKADPKELRVMVIGDSVVYAGTRVDQAKVATTILAKSLSEKLKRPVIVGNISAQSWGPPNQLAYIQKFGLFDADIVVLVMSSHDFDDVPNFKPKVGVSAVYPDKSPPSALIEFIQRYAFRKNDQEDDYTVKVKADPKDVKWGMEALAGIVEAVRHAGAKMVVIQHSTKHETKSVMDEGHQVEIDTLAKLGITPYELLPGLQKDLAAGKNPYLDNIHMNAVGQRTLEEVLEQAVTDELKTKSAPPVQH